MTAKLRRALAALPWTSPALLLIGAIVLFPAGYMVWTSTREFSQYGVDRGPAGWENYRRLLDLQSLDRILLNTVVWVVGVVAVTIVISLALAFTDYDILGGGQFVGLQNFQRMFFEDTRYAKSVTATFKYVLASVPLRLIFALGIAMLIGRYFLIIPTLALAGCLVKKDKVPESAGTFRTDTPLFAALLFGVTIIVAGLTFFPAIALGPVVEQLGI